MKRKQFTTTIQEGALKNIKKLAIDLDRSVNDLLEEGIEYLLKKYKENPHKLSESSKKVAAKPINPMIMSTMEKLLEEYPHQFHEAYERVLERMLNADGSVKRKIKIKGQSSASS